jgi:hypothetical protein
MANKKIQKSKKRVALQVMMHPILKTTIKKASRECGCSIPQITEKVLWEHFLPTVPYNR